MKRENYKEKRGKERVILNKRIKQKIAKREREREREKFNWTKLRNPLAYSALHYLDAKCLLILSIS